MSEAIYRVDGILEEDEEYALTIFHPDHIVCLEDRLPEKRGRSYVTRVMREQVYRAYPEEVVR